MLKLPQQVMLHQLLSQRKKLKIKRLPQLKLKFKLSKPPRHKRLVKISQFRNQLCNSKETTSVIRKSMRKFGVSSMLTRTHFLGNIEEMKKLIHQMVGLIHQVDSPSIRETRKISLIRTLTRKFGAS